MLWVTRVVFLQRRGPSTLLRQFQRLLCTLSIAFLRWFTPEPVAAPAWFQLARQEQAVQGLPWAPVILLGRLRIVSSIVGASTHMPQLHVHLPGEDGLRHILSPAATARVVTGGRGDWRLAWEMDGGIAFPQLVISPRSGRA